MRTLRVLLVAALLAVCLPLLQAAPEEKRPHLGFLYAAGGQRGTTVTITAGGQNLRGARQVYVTGSGVTGKVVRFLPGRRFGGDQAREVRKLLEQKRKELTPARPGKGGNRQDRERKPDRKPEGKPAAGKANDKPAGQATGKPAGKARPEVKPPEHYLLDALPTVTLRELKKVAEYFFDPAIRQQMSPQIADRVEIELTIAPDAAPGDRELRLGTPTGLTNPLCFSVGLHPEVNEVEINDFRPMKLPAATSTFVLNGQVDRRDIDRFLFSAEKGQQLVLSACARRLVPYMADAVPGWFQATLSLKNASGEVVAFVDDYRFDPDPVMFFLVPEDGEYELEVGDAIYRGREDFVYRLTIGEEPFITSMFPRGGRRGSEVTAEVTGFNLPFTTVSLDTAADGPRFRHRAWREGGHLTNPMAFAVDDLPECLEAPGNDTTGRAQPITLPVIVNGRIESAGDVDVYSFTGRAGDEVVAEVYGRRLDSPLDSLLFLLSPSGEVVALNDDREVRRIGLVTHHADSCLRATLPADGTYCVKLTDAPGHGGEEYAYRLRVGPPSPDYTVFLNPSALNIAAGSVVPFTVHVLRKDGFTGAIDVALSNPPPGFMLSGGRIPAGSESVRMTLTAPQTPPKSAVPLRLTAQAVVDGRTIVRSVVPTEDLMQAFLYRHLVPTEELLVAVARGRVRIPPLKLVGDGPVKIPAGGTARVRITAPGLPQLDRIQFELANPPAGVSLRDVGTRPGELLIVLSAEAGKAVIGTADNLIVEVYAEPVDNRSGGKRGAAAKTVPKRVYVCVLPAIPVEIVTPVR
jgi:hypothetical protein